MTNMNLAGAVASGSGVVTDPAEIEAVRQAYDETELVDLPDNFHELPLQERWNLLGVKFTMHATGKVTQPNEKE